MKISRDTLQTYFEKPLPSTAAIADAFTFHCFEIEEVEGDVLDVKVLPNRAADCQSEAGMAAELSSILDLPLKQSLAEDFSTQTVVVSLARINALLGTDFSEAEVEDVFRRLHFRVEKNGGVFYVTARATRIDIQIPEDVAEEVGRILGYDRVPTIELPSVTDIPDQAQFRGIEKIKDQLVELGYIEVSTRSFAKTGDIYLAKPLDQTKPALRTSLEENLKDALEKAKLYAPLALPPKQKVKLFEIGTVFPKEGEYLELRMTEPASGDWKNFGTMDKLPKEKLEGFGEHYTPVRYKLGAYKPFSVYPFITRDIALWVPSGIESIEIEQMIRECANTLLVRLDQFDRFEKEGRISYAFRLVFQATDRTLTDTEVQQVMEKIVAKLRAKEYEVR